MARYELSDLPKFGDDKNLDPFEFVHQFEFFLKYIDLQVNTPTKVETAIKLFFGACMQKKGRIYFEHKIGETPKNEDGDEIERTVAQWNKILEDFCKAFHPLGTTTEQLMIKWDTLKWNPNVETIEDFVHKINQLAKVLKKTEADKVLKIKIASPSKDIYMLIMTCTSVADIVSVINQMQAMNWLPSPGPNTQLSTQGLNSSALHAHVAQCTSKAVRFEVDKLENTPDWPERLGDRIASKVNDKISKLAEDINKRSQDKDHRNHRDEDYRDKYERSRDRHRNRYCDGHREERQKGL